MPKSLTDDDIRELINRHQAPVFSELRAALVAFQERIRLDQYTALPDDWVPTKIGLESRDGLQGEAEQIGDGDPGWRVTLWALGEEEVTGEGCDLITAIEEAVKAWAAAETART